MGGVEQAEAGGARVEVGVRVHGQQRHVRQAEQRVEQREADQGGEDEVLRHEAQALEELRPSVRGRRTPGRPARSGSATVEDERARRRRRRPARGRAAPPNAAMRMPVIDGPIIRPACQGIEPSATALASRARSTSCGTRDSRAGSSKARNALLSAASATRYSTRTRPSTGHGEGDDQGGRGPELRRQEQPHPIHAIGEDAAEELERHERHALGEPEVAQIARARAVSSHVSHANVMYSARWPST